MCPKCNKAHATGEACPAQKRSAAQILADIDTNLVANRAALDKLASDMAKAQERMDALEKAQKSRRGGVSLPGVEDEKETFSFARLVLSLLHKDERIAPFERDVCRQAGRLSGREQLEDGRVMKRDLETGVDTAAGFLVPHQVSAELIPLLRANTVTDKLGLTRMDGMTGGSFAINRQTGGATVYDVAETEAPTASNLTVGQVEVRPREMAALTKVSNRLLRLSNPSIESLIREDLMKSIALAHDLRVLRGTGGKQPVGVANTPGISTRSVAAALSVDNLYNMMYDLSKENAFAGRLGWVMHPRTVNGLRQLKDAEGRYILTPGGTTSAPTNISVDSGTLLGFPYVCTTQIPITLGAGAASQIFFGNWADVLLATWANMEISVSGETSDAFAKRQTHIMIAHEYDIVVKHAKSFCVDSTIL